MLFFKNFFVEYRWEALGALVLLFVVFINRFPSGYIFLGGDVLQPINMAKSFFSYYYELFGSASLFFGIFYLLDVLRVSDTAQLSWYLGIFLFGSYASFLTFSFLVFPQVSKLTRTIVALFYAMNLYTLYIFTASWGFSHYQIVYIFIPILTGLYIRVLETKKAVYVFFFFLAMFFASMSFSNPAFALSLGIYFFLLTILLFLFHFVKPDKRVIKLIAIVAIGSSLLNAYWVLPLLPQLRSGIQGVYASEFVDLSERLEKTSNAIFDTIRLLPTSEQSRYYPANFPYPNFSWLKKYLVFLAFAPFFLVLIGYMRKKDTRERRLYGTFFVLFVIFTALVARVRFPFDTINNFLFHLPGFNVLRSWDKLATIVPFLLSMLLLLALATQEGKRYFKTVLASFVIVAILLALPFYAGGIQTKLSYIFSTQKAKDFRTAKLSALVKVPEEYYAVTKVIQADRADNKIAMLPFSPGSSTGRVNLPKWKVNGPDATSVLYSKKYVELYSYYIPGWMFAQDFENAQYDPQWIVDLYGLIGVKYILYHKDAKPDSIEKMEPARKYLENIGSMKSIDDNRFFTLYTIDEDRIFPYVYVTDESNVFIKSSPEGLSEKAQDLHKKVSVPNYERQNPKKTVVAVDRLASQSHIFLNEKYDPLWRAEYTALDGKRVMLERDENVKYANAWKVADNLPGGSIEIYYAPLKLFYIGQWISGIALLLTVFGIVVTLRKKNNS
ncbi:MAG: hypothetical protein Q7S04_03705 [Candidatus Moranbacteria bacterium]|nr:hypothetical protein [Candidatus Moranbacteria bacterium]